MVEYIDVYERSECPPLPKGFRYFDMIGGQKNIRMFIAPDTMLRGEFMRLNAEHLDEALAPIFQSDSVDVRQDMAYAVPGFYIVNPRAHYSSIDDMPRSEYLRLANVKYWVRKGMREALGIEHIHVYYEEPEGIRHAHEWMLPIYNIDESKRIYDINVNSYLEGFKFVEQKRTILDYNEKIKCYIEQVGLAENDAALKAALRGSESVHLFRPNAPVPH